MATILLERGFSMQGVRPIDVKNEIRVTSQAQVSADE